MKNGDEIGSIVRDNERIKNCTVKGRSKFKALIEVHNLFLNENDKEVQQ
jgi:hypothetical protein